MLQFGNKTGAEEVGKSLRVPGLEMLVLGPHQLLANDGKRQGCCLLKEKNLPETAPICSSEQMGSRARGTAMGAHAGLCTDALLCALHTLHGCSILPGGDAAASQRERAE